jgi:rhodanese-related sulfurtransferase
MRTPLRAGFVVWFMSVLVLATTAVSAEGVSWTIVNWKVRHDFPSVRRIEPNELAKWLKDTKRVQPALLDVRTQAEYDISHLHGARRVEPGSAAGAINLAKDKPIVTYCSVGYRSGAFAKKLQDAGFPNVQNMAGSIFKWANESRPLESDSRAATQAHPYNGIWGRLLKSALRAKVPDAGSRM